MKKISKKQILLLLLFAGLFILTGCKAVVDSTGATLPEKIIYLDTPWSKMFQNETFFTPILVYPLAQVINFLAQYVGTVAAVILTVVGYNLLILPISVKSTVSTQKMQAIQPELNKIQMKYEGRDDNQSRMMMASEQQALMNKYGINPLAGIAGLFLQIPFLIAMYNAVQRAAAVCQGTIAGIPLMMTPKAALKDPGKYWIILLVFVLMAISQFFATKVPQWIAESSKKKDVDKSGYKAQLTPENAANPSMAMSTVMMVCMVALFGFGWPISMSVYWLINSIITILKTIFIQRKYVDHE